VSHSVGSFLMTCQHERLLSVMKMLATNKLRYFVTNRKKNIELGLWSGVKLKQQTLY